MKNFEDRDGCGCCAKRPRLWRVAIASLLRVKKPANLALLEEVEANVRLERPWTSLVAFARGTRRAIGLVDIIVNAVCEIECRGCFGILLRVSAERVGKSVSECVGFLVENASVGGHQAFKALRECAKIPKSD